MTGFRTSYPQYDVLKKWNSPSWDDVTRRVVRDRLEHVPQRRFFTAEEWQTLESVCDRLIPQGERAADRIPIVPWIDRQLAHGVRAGYRFAELPAQCDAWRVGIEAIDDETRRRLGSTFARVSPDNQDRVLHAIASGDVRSELWHTIRPRRFFREVLLRCVVNIYYAHPAAWNEIGFGGPASPRGYVRLGFDQRDPWEAEESRG